ncbi:MAG: flagellar basal body P-ring formation protein FlgA [Gammaproteobacteria bacterium]|nr:flagellar basal body P-ring formation protein FlgA [Gammaproteobacteria bacterium]
MNLRNIFKIIVFSLASAYALHSAAATQSVQEIKATAKSFLNNHFANSDSRVKITIGGIDPRLRLKPCDNNLSAFIPQGSNLSGNTVVGIRCVGEQSWHIYVPVKIAIYQEVVVFKKNMVKGEVISAKDLEVKPIEISSVRINPITAKEQLLGSVMKQNAMAGDPAARKVACMVCKGDKLTVLAGNEQFTVTIEGEAMEDGHYGEQVAIKNPSSSRVVSGTVIASKRVSVGLQ